MSRDDFDVLRRNLRVMVPVFSVALSGALGLIVVQGLGGLEQHLRHLRDAFTGRFETVPTFTRALGVGTEITEDDLVYAPVPAEYVPPTAMRSSEAAVGRILRERALAGDFVREERLVAPELGDGIDALIPHGMRIESLDLDPVAYVSAFVEPGMRVDVIRVLPDEDGDYSDVSTMAKDVLVLAVNEKISETANGEKVMTPQVSVVLEPAMAERLTHAATFGRLMLTLRSAFDDPRAEPSVPAPIGRESRRMTPAEFAENVTPEQVAAWYDRIDPPPPPIDPAIERAVLQATASER